MAKFKVTMLYAATALGTAVATLLVMGFLAPLQNEFPIALRSRAAWAINIVPAFVSGFMIFAALTRWFLTHRGREALPSHFVRASFLYVVSGVLIALLRQSWSDPDFWFYAQFLIIPSSAYIGGIFGDLVASAYFTAVTRPPGERH